MMKKVLIFLAFLLITGGLYSQSVIRPKIDAQTLRGLDTNNALSNYIMTKYRASLLFAPITGSLVYEILSNKSTATSTSTTLYPSWSGAKAYSDSVAALLQRISNLSTATSTSTTKYPSWSGAKAYSDSIASLLERLTNKATTTGTSTTKYMSQGAIKTYGDSIAGVMGYGFADVKADNISSVKFTLLNGDTSLESFGHMHIEYSLVAEMDKKVAIADSNSTAAGNYVTNKKAADTYSPIAKDAALADTGSNKKLAAYYDMTTKLALKINKADSTGNAEGNYMTRKQVTDVFAPIASPIFTGVTIAPVVAVSSTDTISGTYPVGSMFVRITASDTSMWVKIRMDGVLSARWKKLTP